VKANTRCCVVVVTEEQRQANESLVAVSAVFELSRAVVNESMTLLSDLQSTEADALAALQRTTRQHTAALAINQVNVLVQLLLYSLLSLVTVCFVRLSLFAG